jgi:putative ABC transport system permease protein
MNTWTLVRRSLAYYRRGHLWVVLGCAVSTAILVGALVVGDSVRHSLHRIVSYRLGRTEVAMVSGDRFFRAAAADELAGSLGTEVAPVLMARGMASTQGGRNRVNTVQVVGVDGRFGTMGGAPARYADLPPDEILLNGYLASRLDVEAGDEVVLRIENLESMPRDAPLALDSDTTVARRLRIRAVVSDTEFGRFNLRAEQVAPLTAFVSLNFLSKELGLDGRANTLLIAERPGVPLTLEEAERGFAQVWTLDDAGLYLKLLEGRGGVELRSSRIFLDPAVAHAAEGLDPEARVILTYLVNEIRMGEEKTPYSFVSAPGAPLVPSDMADDEILVNSWLAGDLKVREGDRVELTYYVLGPNRNLIEEASSFRVRQVVPLEGIYADRDLLPDFPGLARIESTRDWRPGIPIDLDRIRDRDEAYWEDFRGTPKAFVSAGAARQMWANRFGEATAVRFPSGDRVSVESALKDALAPAQLGFIFREVQAEGLRAGTQGVDFGQLFLGLSFFIIVAALLLTGLLFFFNVEKRSEEGGLLLALGFSRRQVRRLLLSEGAVLVFLGGLLGCVTGVAFNLVVLEALKTVWKGAIGTSALEMHISPAALGLGTVLGMLTAFFTIWLVAGRLVKQPVSGLQKGLTRLAPLRARRPRAGLWVGILSLAATAFILATADLERGREAFGVFFTAGTLVLLGSLALTSLLLFRLGQGPKKARLSLFSIGVRGTARRRIRSLTLIGLLASGLFIVFTVGANRRNAVQDAEIRGSGTGGFALFAESAIPVLYDLNSPEGARFYGLDGLGERSLAFVPFRVRPGDDASCLNLNRVSSPRLLGVDPEELSRREAFTFIKSTGDIDPQDPWSGLDGTLPGGVIPAVADNTVIVWGLGKAVGDTLTYRDEKGEPFSVLLVGGLANSVFQGSLIISERHFLEKYPSLSGYRLFLIDAPREDLSQTAGDISRAMQDQGMDLVPTSDRLAEFNQVENTYLAIFLILGSFGLVLGSVGIGIVVSRNVSERLGELALLRAVGFSRRSLQALVLSEHLALLLAGILLGLLAALMATLPSLLAPGSGIPYATLLILLVIVLLNGGIWTYAAVRRGTRQDLLPALRRE